MRWGRISGSDCSLFPHVEGLSPKIYVDSVVRSPGDEHQVVRHEIIHEPMKPIQYPCCTHHDSPPLPLPHGSNKTQRPQLNSTCLTVPSSPRCTFNLPSPPKSNCQHTNPITSNQLTTRPYHPTQPPSQAIYANKTYLSGFQSPASTSPGSTIRYPFGKSALANDYIHV